MAKEVVQTIEIDENGKVHLLPPEGTVGDECHDLQRALEEIAGFRTEVSVLGEDAHQKSNHVSVTQDVRGS